MTMLLQICGPYYYGKLPPGNWKDSVQISGDHRLTKWI